MRGRGYLHQTFRFSIPVLRAWKTIGGLVFNVSKRGGRIAVKQHARARPEDGRMSYGSIRRCLTSEMGGYYAIQRIVRAPSMLQFTISYVIPFPSIALRLQRSFSLLTSVFSPQQIFPWAASLEQTPLPGPGRTTNNGMPCAGRGSC